MKESRSKKSKRRMACFLLLIAAAFCILPILAANAEAAAELPISDDLLALIQEYAVMPVTVVCLIVGMILKNAFTTFNNKLIPIVLIPVGIVAVLWMNGWYITPDTVFAGVCSAVASIGLHSGGKNTIEALKTALKPPEQ